MSASIKELGQYFTVSPSLQTIVYNYVRNRGELLLEPSFGAGHLLQPFLTADAAYPMMCYEIDERVKPVVTFGPAQRVFYGDFLAGAANLGRKFKTIIGNPPYVKQRSGNLYLKFISACFDALDDGGELVFIVPSDFLKLTHAAPLIAKMVDSGSFTDFSFPADERLFEGAAIDVVVFRYQKGLLGNACLVNGERKIYTSVRGVLTFGGPNGIPGRPVEEQFDVYVGLVSGRDEVYKQPFGGMSVLVDEGRQERFIFAESFPTGDGVTDAHLLAHKAELLGRGIRAFKETNWYEWGAPRNIRVMRETAGRPCIYVRTLTRNVAVAFRGVVGYFGGGLLCMIPKAGAGAEVDLDAVVAHLNSEECKENYMYAGRFKMGQKQLCCMMI
jgi:adenine-specific DNA-methyltransferase